MGLGEQRKCLNTTASSGIIMEMGLETFFEVFLRKESVFFDKRILQSTYIPENILHREEQTKQIANILAPALKMDKPSNLFVYAIVHHFCLFFLISIII